MFIYLCLYNQKMFCDKKPKIFCITLQSIGFLLQFKLYKPSVQGRWLYNIIFSHQEKTMEQKNEEIDNLKKQLATMYMDLQKKNSVLQELTSQRTVTIKARKSEINGNIMSHEAILNALSEDEYIVWCCYEKFIDLGFFYEESS